MSDSEKKHDAILNAAREVFTKFGFQKTTLGDIAARAGIGKATIYYYFDNKETIFSSVVARESEVLLKALVQVTGDCQAADAKLLAFVKERYEHILRLKNLYDVSSSVYRELLPMVEAAREEFFDRELRMLVGIIDSGILLGEFRKCDPELVALAVLSSLSGMTTTFILYGKDGLLAEGLDNLIEIFLDGLRIRR